MFEPLPRELLDLMTPAELAEYERILLAELADLDDGPARSVTSTRTTRRPPR
jgi:hypothetical protein